MQNGEHSLFLVPKLVDMAHRRLTATVSQMHIPMRNSSVGAAA